MPCLDMPEKGAWQSAPAGLPPTRPLPGRTDPLSKGLLQSTICLLEAARSVFLDGSLAYEIRKKETTMAWTTPTLVEICIGLEINGYLPAEF
jgi:coenzyme PQQ precursor peptide PqqA